MRKRNARAGEWNKKTEFYIEGRQATKRKERQAKRTSRGGRRRKHERVRGRKVSLEGPRESWLDSKSGKT